MTNHKISSHLQTLYEDYKISICSNCFFCSTSPFLQKRRKNWEKHYKKLLDAGRRLRSNKRYIAYHPWSSHFWCTRLITNKAKLTCFYVCQIDPSILGGLVVEFGQKVFDMSIRTRARQMERFLREPVNFGNLWKAVHKISVDFRRRKCFFPVWFGCL